MSGERPRKGAKCLTRCTESCWVFGANLRIVMSSIMRCRSGLMALSVMRDAPVLMEVANPSSQDRTPRRAIVSAVSPAAAPYRASGLVLWGRSGLECTIMHWTIFAVTFVLALIVDQLRFAGQYRRDTIP